MRAASIRPTRRPFLAWADDGAYTPDGDGRFDIGNATSAALRRSEPGCRPRRRAGPTSTTNGNGSLMRILPLALVERDVPTRQLVEHAQRASASRTDTRLRRPRARSTSLIAASARGEAPADALAGARQRSGASTRRPIVDRLAALDTSKAGLAAGRGYVVGRFWSAWDAFAGATDYRDTIERAVRYGNDTDTTACIAGGPRRVPLGHRRDPARWLAGMRGRDIVEPLVDRLIETDGWRTSTQSHPVDWVDLRAVPRLLDVPGRLGMTFLPGKQRDGWTGLHWRDLETDAARLGGDRASIRSCSWSRTTS